MGLGNLLIRADASPDIGTGHVMRSLALAQCWQDAGGDVLFAMARSTKAIRSRLITENCALNSIQATPGSREDADYILQQALRLNAEWIVIDGYNFDTEYLKQIKSEGHKILFIDDEGKCVRYVSDAVLNQNITALESWYTLREPGTQLLLGPQFCLLRREFSQWRRWKREIPQVGRKVLVTLGGSTPAEAALRIIESIQTLNIEELNIVLAIGGSSADANRMERALAGAPGNVSICKDVADMATLMGWADLAISAAGSTCWEMCLLGLPAVLVSVASNQTPIAKELHRQRCAFCLGNAHDFSPRELAGAVEELLLSREKRSSLSFNARRLVDGCGGERVLSAMLKREQRSFAAEMAGTRS